MKRSSVCTAALVALGSFTGPVSAEMFEFTGYAQSQQGKTLYEERHQVEGICDNAVFQPIGHRVAYTRQTESGTETFAEKTLDYSPSAIRPTVKFQQPGFDESLKITYLASGSAEVVWRQPGGDTKRSSTEVSDRLVVDSGFDNLVRQNWKAVVSGESIKFRFLAPTRGTDYAFILEPAQSPNIKADHLVQIRPDNLVLKLLVDPIVLGYNKKGALTSYSGLTNVRENADQNYTATIRYAVDTYPECELTP